MRPVSVTSPGASLTLPLRMVAAGTGATVGVTLWVLGDGRYEAANFPNFIIDPSSLVWDWSLQTSNYTTVQQQTESAAGFATWQTESSLGLSPYQLEAAVPRRRCFHGLRGHPGLGRGRRRRRRDRGRGAAEGSDHAVPRWGPEHGGGHAPSRRPGARGPGERSGAPGFGRPEQCVECLPCDAVDQRASLRSGAQPVSSLLGQWRRRRRRGGELGRWVLHEGGDARSAVFRVLGGGLAGARGVARADAGVRTRPVARPQPGATQAITCTMDRLCRSVPTPTRDAGSSGVRPACEAVIRGWRGLCSEDSDNGGSRCACMCSWVRWDWDSCRSP
jgi:hypothetical protein